MIKCVRQKRKVSVFAAAENRTDKMNQLRVRVTDVYFSAPRYFLLSHPCVSSWHVPQKVGDLCYE